MYLWKLWRIKNQYCNSFAPIVFQQSVSAVGHFVANRFTYDRVDEYDLSPWISVHHIVQMLLVIIAIVIIEITIYNKLQEVKYHSLDLLWGQGLYQKLRFVLVSYNKTQSILVSTDLKLSPKEIIKRKNNFS